MRHDLEKNLHHLLGLGVESTNFDCKNEPTGNLTVKFYPTFEEGDEVSDWTGS